METPWFETWFDSPYYPILYAHRDDTEAEGFILQLLKSLQPTPGSHFLDLACGRGRHARFLHAQGFEVTGFDLSPASIADANMHRADQLRFMVHDMRDPFPATYDYIFNLFTSFGYFDSLSDNLKVLKNVAMSLKPNGVFVMDFLNAHKVIAGLVPEESKELDGITFHVRRSVENGCIVKRIHVVDQGTHLDYMEKVQALTKEDIEALMLQAGLHSFKAWGNYRGSDFDSATSDRLILFAKII